MAKVPSFEEAIRTAGAAGTRTAMSVYSRKPSHLELAQRSLNPHVLFLNGPTIVARVGRELGAATLCACVRPAVISENTMRSGFAPGLE